MRPFSLLRNFLHQELNLYLAIKRLPMRSGKKNAYYICNLSTTVVISIKNMWLLPRRYQCYCCFAPNGGKYVGKNYLFNAILLNLKKQHK